MTSILAVFIVTPFVLALALWVFGSYTLPLGLIGVACWLLYRAADKAAKVAAAAAEPAAPAPP